MKHSKSELPKIIHGDVKATQYLYFDEPNIFSDGSWTDFTFKLNDFNRGHLLKVKRGDSNTICPFHETIEYMHTRGAPERYEDQSLTEKIDVGALGAIFYRLLTGHDPYLFYFPSDNSRPRRQPGEHAVAMLKSGAPLSWPPVILYSKDPCIQALVQMTQECIKLNPAERPDPYQVAAFLESKLPVAP
mmetsp:Transcript_24798/g.40575  ORF Transcript_24798/g.40575 Transcript_24798/m.40575 type:complete len:188 (+) Transcript_24798:1-564(+)